MNNNKISDLLNLEPIKFLFSIFKNHKSKIRLVGGSIRDTIINREIKDIDTATSLEPYDVLEYAFGLPGSVPITTGSCKCCA